MSGRDVSLDVAKTVAMFAIVLIHVRTNAPLADYGLVAGLDNFLTTFVLSLFILVSGHLSRGLILSCDWAKLFRRVAACLWPVFTMMVLLGQVIDFCILGHFQPPAMGWLRYVLSTGWFFWCLALCLVLTFAAQAVSRGRRGWLALILALVFAGLWALPVGLCHAKDMIVYFWFGVYAYPAYVRRVHRHVIGLAALAASLAVCLVLPDFREIGLFVHDAVMPAGTFTWTGCGLAIVKYALGLSASLGILEVARALASLIKRPGVFASIGAQTMGIFFIHIQLLGAFYATVGWTGWGFFGRFALAVLLFCVSYCLVVLTKMNPTVDAILWNPLRLFIQRKDVAK